MYTSETPLIDHSNLLIDDQYTTLTILSKEGKEVYAMPTNEYAKTFVFFSNASPDSVLCDEYRAVTETDLC